LAGGQIKSIFADTNNLRPHKLATEDTFEFQLNLTRSQHTWHNKTLLRHVYAMQLSLCCCFLLIWRCRFLEKLRPNIAYFPNILY